MKNKQDKLRIQLFQNKNPNGNMHYKREFRDKEMESYGIVGSTCGIQEFTRIVLGIAAKSIYSHKHHSHFCFLFVGYFGLGSSTLSSAVPEAGQGDTVSTC